VICCQSTKAASDVEVEKSHFIAGDDASKENQGQRTSKSAAFWDAIERLSLSS
jgi:hypothetical protein